MDEMSRHCSIISKSQPSNNNSILGAQPHKPNSTIFQIPREDKGKGIFHEAPEMTSNKERNS